MTRQSLLEHIAKDKDVKAACINICKGLDGKEFYQHIMLKICEINEQRLLEIYANGYLRWYIVKIIMNEGSEWLTTSKKVEYLSEAHDVICDEYNFDLDVEVSRVEGNINNLPNFEKRMLLEYIKSGSYLKLSEETNIPYRTIGNHIKRIKDKLK
jgi:DNA-directed RNA polymerase specialized sigma24 family protein